MKIKNHSSPQRTQYVEKPDLGLEEGRLLGPELLDDIPAEEKGRKVVGEAKILFAALLPERADPSPGVLRISS
jgi:hypothetical protein